MVNPNMWVELVCFVGTQMLIIAENLCTKEILRLSTCASKKDQQWVMETRQRSRQGAQEEELEGDQGLLRSWLL